MPHRRVHTVVRCPRWSPPLLLPPSSSALSVCWWVCSTFCPDSAIAVSEGKPVIDYDHCKGCMICVAQCPPHAIAAVPEAGAMPKEAA